jgi:hypothetical protein
MTLSELVQVVLSFCTVVGAVYAVRIEVRSRVEGLNQQVIALQDRKIKLLEEEVGKASKRIFELEATVKVLTERRTPRNNQTLIQRSKDENG